MLTLVTPPAEEPITLAEAKRHLRGPVDLEDDLISGLITAARQLIEAELDRALITSTWELTLEGFPRWSSQGGEYPPLDNLEIRLPNPPLASVVSITYVDTAGATQTLSPSTYQVEEGAPGRIVLAFGKSWPATRRQPGAVTIRFTAGYGEAAAVPDCLKVGIKLVLSCLYENRGEEDFRFPSAVKHVISPEDWGSYA